MISYDLYLPVKETFREPSQDLGFFFLALIVLQANSAAPKGRNGCSPSKFTATSLALLQLCGGRQSK